MSPVSVATSNRFEVLSDSEDEMSQDEANVQIQPAVLPSTAQKRRIVPICVKNFPTHRALLEVLKAACPVTGAFTVTPRRDFSKVVPSTIANYQRLTSLLDAKKVEYYTFSTATVPSKRFILRGCPFNADPMDIKLELTELGYDVRAVDQIKRGDALMPLFTVVLAPALPGSKPVDLGAITRLQGCVVSAEAPHKGNSTPVTMCFRCQKTGHLAPFCHQQARCVKCDAQHASSDCPRPREQPCTCTNCGQEHAANYRGCAYLKAAQRRQPARRAPVPSSTAQRAPLRNQTAMARPVTSTLSYSSVTANHPPALTEPAAAPTAAVFAAQESLPTSPQAGRLPSAT